MSHPSVTETDAPTRTSQRPQTDDGDHDRFAHYVVPPAAITRAAVLGTPVTAVCGKTWVPSRNPEGYPICPACKEIRERVEEIWGPG